MKGKRFFGICLAAALVIVLVAGLAFAQAPESPQGTGFTYQGQLKSGGSPYSGTCDLKFSLFDALSGGSQVGTTQSRLATQVTEGYFTIASLDFGSGIFFGDARYLEIQVRCPAGSGNYSTLSPRQALTASPAALSLALPFSGEAATSEPLVTLANNGTGDGLYVTGAGGYGLRLDYAGADGMLIHEPGGHGVYIYSPVYSGLVVNEAGDNGVRVDSAGSSGVSVGISGGNGVSVESAGGNGLYVGQAAAHGVDVEEAEHGVHVEWARAVGLFVYGAGVDGVYVGSASDDGVQVNSSGDDGVLVSTAGGDGVQVTSAGGDGVRVTSASGDGLYVEKAGTPSAFTPSSDTNGVEVAGAQGHGMYVGRADEAGVWVESAGGSGLTVYSADDYGVYVAEASRSGVYVKTAGMDGVIVDNAGDPANHVWNLGYNGFEVAGAEEHGLYVGWADVKGVYVHGAGEDALYVNDADLNGLDVESAGANGVSVVSADWDGLSVQSADDDGVDVWDAANYAGNFGGDIFVLGSCIGCAQAALGVNAGSRPLRPGEIVAVQGMQPAALDNASVLWQVVPAEGGAAPVGVVRGRAEIDAAAEGQPLPEGATGQRLVPREGEALPGEYVTIVIAGPMQVQASVESGPITAGARLTVDSAGRVRAIRTVTVGGMALAESAPVLGIALEEVAEDGLIWVLVNPQ